MGREISFGFPRPWILRHMFHFGPGTASSICFLPPFFGSVLPCNGYGEHDSAYTAPTHRKVLIRRPWDRLGVPDFQNLGMDHESARDAESQTAPFRREFGVYVSAFRVTCAWTLLRHAQPPEERQGAISVRRRAHSHWRHVQQAPQSIGTSRAGYPWQVRQLLASGSGCTCIRLPARSISCRASVC